jgi:hypothetical protein
LSPQARSEFLRGRRELESQHHRGPGAIYRVASDLQSRYFDPPIFTGLSKYD